MSDLTHPHTVCSWVGVDENEEREITCGRPATYTIEEPGGRRWYACTEHLSEVHARAPGGLVTHDAQHRADEGRPKVTPESSITWE
jgi:hypothetical protein